MTANEVRTEEGWPSIPGGDDLAPPAVGGKPAEPASDSKKAAEIAGAVEQTAGGGASADTPPLSKKLNGHAYA